MGFIVRTHLNGWMDENLVENWLRHVWSRVRTLRNQPSLIVWDSFGGHLNSGARHKMKALKTIPRVIPDGMTLILATSIRCLHK